MKRLNTMIATIIGTTANAIQLIINLVAFLAIVGALADLGNDSAMVALTVIGVSIILLAFIIVAFILTCRIFKYMNASSEVYASKKGLIISAIVFNFLVAILLFAFGFSGNVSSIIINVLCALALIATNVLYIVDLCLEKNRVQKQQETINVTKDVKTNEINVEESKQEYVKSDEEKSE